MRRPSALALLILGLSLPASAQRGGGMHSGRGFAATSRGFSSGGGMHSGGGFAAPGGYGAPNRGNAFGRSGFATPRGFDGTSASRLGGGYARYPGTYTRAPYGGRPAFYSHSGIAGNQSYANNNRHPNRGNGSGYRYPGIYNYRYPGFFNYGFGYPFDDAFLNFYDPFWSNNGLGTGDTLASDAYPPDGGYAQPNYDSPVAVPEAYGSQPPDPGGQPYAPQGSTAYPQTYAPGWYGPYVVASASPVSSPAAEEATTLVFRDGRPPLKIGNYALTRSAIYLTGARIYEIPLSELDLSATVQVNRQAGIEFQLP